MGRHRLHLVGCQGLGDGTVNTTERVRSMATELCNASKGLCAVRVIVVNTPLPGCPWCTRKGAKPATCRAEFIILHDGGVVPTCEHCFLTAACKAVEQSSGGCYEIYKFAERRAA